MDSKNRESTEVDPSNPFELFSRDLCLLFLTYLPKQEREMVIKTVPSFWRTFRRSTPRNFIPQIYKWTLISNRVQYTRYGAIDILHSSTRSSSMLYVHTLNINFGLRRLQMSLIRTINSFVLPNGDLSYYGYPLEGHESTDYEQDSEDEEMPELSYLLNIYRF